MRNFIFPNLERKGALSVAVIVDDDCNPYEEISKEGRYLELSEIPEYAKEFFNCLEFDIDKKVIVNFKKAQDQTKERIRIERQPFLNNLDILYSRSLEINKGADKVIQEKKRLRNITNDIDFITTLEELMDFKISSTLTYTDLLN